MSSELDLLYGDLDAQPIPAAGESQQELKETVASLRAQVSELEARSEAAAKERDEARKQNTALKRNISCLWKTAKAEVDRKDASIARLRVQLEEAQQQQQQSRGRRSSGRSGRSGGGGGDRTSPNEFGIGHQAKRARETKETW